MGIPIGTTIPILKDIETPAKTPVETPAETPIETPAETHIRNPHIQIVTNTPYPEQLALQKAEEKPCFNLLGELKNIYVKVPLLQALDDVPIYAKTVRDLCVKKP